MYKFLLPVLLVLLVLLVLFIYTNNTNNTDINDGIIEYKIEHKKKPDLSDKFNIKEFDIINENIIIHNKFKNELLDSKKNKESYNQQKYKTNEIEKKELNDIININAKKIKKHELTKQYTILLNDISSLKKYFKLDLNNFLNDKKQNKISKNEIIIIINKIDNEIKNNLNKIKKIKLTYSDIDEIELINNYENTLLIKDDILNKKRNIYTRFI